MLGKPGPFQIIETDGKGSVDAPVEPPKRRYDCVNYETCLSVACALNWDNFTCLGCSGEMNRVLCWRAHQAMRRDQVADELCELPEIAVNGTGDVNSLSMSIEKNPNDKLLAEDLVTQVKAIGGKILPLKERQSRRSLSQIIPPKQAKT